MVLLLVVQVRLEGQLAKSYRLDHNGAVGSLPASNSVSDIFVERDTVWLGTDKGLSQTADRGITFKNYGGVTPFNTNGISAIAINDGIIWVATATSFTQDNQSIPQGDGLH
jgi:hypothetical protein